MYPRNAASPEPIAIGPVVQISDGAVQTSGCTVRIKPIGVAEGDGGGTTAYSTDGIVLYTPTQAETNYTSFVLIAKKTGCIPVAITIVTSASSVSGKVDVDRLGGDAQSLTDLKDFADAGYDPATNKVQGVALVDTATVLTNLPAITANWLTAAGLATDAIEEIRTAITGGAYGLDTDANGRIRIVDGTGAGELDSSSGSVSVFDFTTAAKALLQTEAEDAIVTHRLDELLNADSDIDGAAPPTVGSVFHELMSKTAGSFTFDQTTDSLEAVIDRGNAAWITATGFSTHSAADVWSAGTRTLTALGFTLAASDLASGIITAAKFAAAAIDAAATSADFVTEIRNAITGGAYALDTDANGRVRIVDGTGAGELDASSGKVTPVDTADDAVLAAIAALNNLSAAQVNAEVVDALATDTYAEPGQGAPGATISLAAKINYIYKAWRNKKTQTSTTLSLMADDGTTVDQKSTVSDDGTTATFGEWATGP